MTTKKIAKVKVGPHDYELLWDADACTGASVNGALLADVGKLLIDPRLSLTQSQDTLLHETLHAIWKQVLVNEYPDEDANSPGEKIIALLTPRILGLLKDNHRLVSFLVAKDV